MPGLSHKRVKNSAQNGAGDMNHMIVEQTFSLFLNREWYEIEGAILSETDCRNAGRLLTEQRPVRETSDRLLGEPDHGESSLV